MRRFLGAARLAVLLNFVEVRGRRFLRQRLLHLLRQGQEVRTGCATDDWQVYITIIDVVQVLLVDIAEQRVKQLLVAYLGRGVQRRRRLLLPTGQLVIVIGYPLRGVVVVLLTVDQGLEAVILLDHLLNFAQLVNVVGVESPTAHSATLVVVELVLDQGAEDVT